MTDDELDGLARSVLATLSDAPAELLAALAHDTPGERVALDERASLRDVGVVHTEEPR